jgi:zinc/manganese transport system substrate-binding protein
MKKILFIVLLLIFSPSTLAMVNVFACEPEWAALTSILAGDKVNIYTASNALQDPHQIQARPSLIAKARSAKLLICTGAELEIGWIPIILRESANISIQPGNVGNFEAAQFVPMLEIPAHLDRANGDVHAMGNPHIQTDPRNYLPIADALTLRLIQLDPGNTNYYQEHLTTFNLQWRSAIKKWEAQALPLKGTHILVQHRGFPYLNNWLGMIQVAELEPKPGMEPSVAYLNQVLSELQKNPVRMVLRAAYQDDRPSLWIAEHTKISPVTIQYTVGGSSKSIDLFTLFDDTIQRLLVGLKP